MIYVIFITICLVFIVSYYLFGRDFFSPAMIYIESFLLACLMAALYANKWNVNYYGETFIFIIGIMLVYVFITYVIKNTSKKICFTKRIQKLTNKRQLQPIHLKKSTFVFFFFISFLGLVLYFRDVYRIAGALGNSNGVAGMYYVYHNNYLLASSETGLKLNFLTNILNTINMVFAYYFSYVFCNNCFRFKEKIVKNIHYLLFVIVYMISLVIGSQRTGIVYVLFSAIFMAFIMTRQNRRWRQGDTSTIRIILFSLFVIIILAYGLSFLGDFMGRTSGQNVIDYFAGYLGGGIPNFSIFLEKHDLKLFSECYRSTDVNAFRSYLGVRCNLATWLQGTAYMGIIVFLLYEVIIAIIYSHFYYMYIYRKQPTVFSDYILVIFAYATKGLLFVGLTDIIASHMFGMGYLLFCVMIWFLDKYCRLKSKKLR